MTLEQVAVLRCDRDGCGEQMTGPVATVRELAAQAGWQHVRTEWWVEAGDDYGDRWEDRCPADHLEVDPEWDLEPFGWPVPRPFGLGDSRIGP